jgi:ribosomal protein L22
MADEKDTTENAEPEAPEAAVEETPAVEAEAAETPAAETPAPRPRRRRAARASRAEAEAVADDDSGDRPAPRARARRAARASASRARAAEDKPSTQPRRRSSRDAEPSLVVRAQAKYVRSSARKARLVCDHIRGKSVEEARAILAFTPRAVARDWSKVLESAVANAEHNHELDGEDLLIKAVHADEGPTLKRFRPRAMGRATPIRKRTSHLTILLTPKG